MISENDGLLLEKYLDGALEEEDRKKFEQRLKSEGELAAALEERRALQGFLQGQDQREALKKTLPEISKKHFQATAKVRPLWQGKVFQLVSAAAVIALLIMVWQPWKPTSLYDQFAQHPPLALTERGDTEADPAEIERTFAAKKYSEAIPLLKNYLQEHPGSAQGVLYLAISYLEVDNFIQAEQLLVNIANGTSTYKYEGNYYLALSAIKQDKPEQAKAQLKRIPADSERYEAAQRLLKKLE